VSQKNAFNLQLIDWMDAITQHNVVKYSFLVISRVIKTDGVNNKYNSALKNRQMLLAQSCSIILNAHNTPPRNMLRTLDFLRQMTCHLENNSLVR
jgi:hypothetical protein